MWAIYAERVRGDFTVLAWLPYKMGLNMVIVSEDCGGEKLVEGGDVIIGYIKK